MMEVPSSSFNDDTQQPNVPQQHRAQQQPDPQQSAVHVVPPPTTIRTKGAIVVVAKCPIPGKSKTRLISLLGPEGSAQLAKAMLSDVLLTIDQCVSF